MASSAPPQTSVDKLLKQISEQYDGLSKQLKQIARYVDAHHDHLGLQGIQEVATACAVQPSAVVRFAKLFGYSGFSEMQKVFRQAIAQQIAPQRNYQVRIREVIESGAVSSSSDIAREFLGGSIAGMTALRDGLHGPSFDKAVNLLFAAETIWIIGARRSFSVAAYLNYALQHTDKRVHLVDGVGSMQDGQLRSVRKGDVLLAISFAPYAEETLSFVRGALARKARLIGVTDSRMSPLAGEADTSLLLQENATLGFRSLTTTMGLMQSLFIALAYKLELAGQALD
jgi:DNA-binding MurR/RpiR family transcriptional regulator